MDCRIKEFSWERPLWELYAQIYTRKYNFFLYSSLPDHPDSRFSYMGCDPYIVIRSTGDQNTIHKDGIIEKKTCSPFDCVQECLSNGPLRFDSDILPENIFFGGAVGYWGYDLKDLLEKLPSHASRTFDVPDAFWMFYRAVIVIDHRVQKKYFIGDPVQVGQLEAAILPGFEVPTKPKSFEYQVSTTVSEKEYAQKIESIKDSIACGDVYEVNLTQRFRLFFQEGEPWRDFWMFKSLTETSPAPFSAILKCNDFFVISSSPERFLKIVEGQAESRPIKGTRPRGGSWDEDEANFLDLYFSDKDRAENVMIVDLVRNDLGRVSETGSVGVKDLFKIEKYSTVFQMISTIYSRLKNDLNAIDAIKAGFPPGSMTGAPKISAMNIIENLEPLKRGVYSGALGYMSFDGNCDLSVIIRTLITKGQEGYFQTGGAIVWDSVAEQEYRECWDKARGILQALENLKL